MSDSGAGLFHSLTSSINTKLSADASIQKTQAQEMGQDAAIMEAQKDDTAGDLERATEENAKLLKSTLLGSKQAQKKEKKSGIYRVQEAALKSHKEEGATQSQRVPPEVERAAQLLSAKTAGEISATTLIGLSSSIREKTSEDEIVKLIRDAVKEPFLVRESLRFLSDHSEGSLKQKLDKVEKDYYKQHKKEIDYGEEIALLARPMSRAGRGEVKTIREEIAQIMREDITPHDIFTDLHDTYGSYNTVKDTIKAYLHYLGEATKDTQAERPYLHSLGTALRKLQAVKQVYAGCSKANKEIIHQAAGLGKIPPQMTFENLAKSFMSLTLDRYPTADKVTKLANQLGIENSLELQIITFSKFRDLVRQVSKDYIYRSISHRDEVFSAIIECLEDLESKVEEREEEALRVELEAAKQSDNRPASLNESSSSS